MGSVLTHTPTLAKRPNGLIILLPLGDVLPFCNIGQQVGCVVSIGKQKRGVVIFGVKGPLLFVWDKKLQTNVK